MNQLAHAKEALAARKAEAEDARAVAEKTQAQIEANKADLVAGDNKQRELLSQVKGDIADLVAKQEAERRAADEAAARARVAATPVSTSGAATAVEPATEAEPATAAALPRRADRRPAPSGGAGAAVAYAYAQLGKPYCYAGVGPDCFDCSGLTMMAWGQAGVGMPHGSTEQYNMFPHVSLSQAAAR